MAEVSRRTLANAIRVLSMDAVEAANSGHPGMPMGMADIAQVLWQDFFNHNPKNPDWFNRDRFVLSNGHGAMLQYSLLHLTGYDLTIDDLKKFRQLHSKTPGHPERGETPGVETTTGPLGQGLANAVGMALAEKVLANTYNRDTHTIIDHWTYVFVGDGCLMEGISHEACSLAGTLGLGKLIVFYDDNGISIDGNVVDWFQDDTVKRFEAYGWHVIPSIDGHDFQSIKKAIETARTQDTKPTLICCKTTIGYGAPTLAGSAKTHGAPLGAQEVAGVRLKLGWSESPFVIPDIIYQAWNGSEKGEVLEKEWLKKLELYKKQFPELAEDLTRRIEGRLPNNLSHIFEQLLQEAQTYPKEIATRKASHLVLSKIGPLCSELLG
ncbi:MAG TPA: transketolase, partial [Gammaproteobacteria bacterium]|nr:transketolase [Gammaproteobacteria bacterium]